MKGVGVGGPLLCIGDLLHDVGESAADIHIPTTLLVSPTTFPDQHPSSLTTLFQVGIGIIILATYTQKGYHGPVCLTDSLHALKLKKQAVKAMKPKSCELFKCLKKAHGKLIENYDQLKEAVDGTDHSWTALTLKLCTALDTADKLVQSTNSHVGLLKNNIKELEKVIKRGDSVVAAATSIYKT